MTSLVSLAVCGRCFYFIVSCALLKWLCIELCMLPKCGWPTHNTAPERILCRHTRRTGVADGLLMLLLLRWQLLGEVYAEGFVPDGDLMVKVWKEIAVWEETQCKAPNMILFWLLLPSSARLCAHQHVPEKTAMEMLKRELNFVIAAKVNLNFPHTSAYFNFCHLHHIHYSPRWLSHAA